MKTIANRLETRFENNTIKFGECFSPYAIEENALRKKYKRLCKFAWGKEFEEDVARYVAKGEISTEAKSPWDIKFKNENGKTEHYECRSVFFETSGSFINLASSSNSNTGNGFAARKVLAEKWNKIDGYFVCDSSKYKTEGSFRWWKIPVESIEQLYRNRLWVDVPRGRKRLDRSETASVPVDKWSVRRPTVCFRRTLSKLFNAEKFQIHF